MNRRQLLALVALLLLAVLTIFLALRTRQAPRLPGDEPHASFLGAEVCLTCHGPEGPLPRSSTHTPRTDCMACHGRR